MPSLSSLIVQRQVATISEVEQAIARQVMHGGDLVTNLLEVAPHCEQALTRVLGESLGLPTAPPGRLAAPDSDALDLLRVEVALRLGVFPLRVSGDTLVVAASDPLGEAALAEVARESGRRIVQVAAPMIRVREGIAAHYGVPLEPRHLRLIQRLDGLERMPASHGPVLALPEPVSALPSNLSSGVSRPPAALVEAASAPGFRPQPTTIEMERVEAPPAQPSVAQPSVAQQVDDEWAAIESGAPPAYAQDEHLHDDAPLERSTDPGDAPSYPSPSDAPPETVSAPPPDSYEDEPASVGPLTDVAPAPFDDSPRPPGMVDRRAALGVLRSELASRAKASKTRTRTARKKGPFSRIDAERELESAQSLDDVLDAFFAFGSQFFEYSALFVVHADLVEGRDAFGPGADLARVQGIGVPLDLPSSLAAVRADGHVQLSRFAEDDLDRELVRDLGRASERPRLRAVVPLTVRQRAVAMLYGDDGSADVNLGGLGDLLGFSALASAQVERLVMLKKTKKTRFGGLAAPRAQAGSVAALARALALPIPEGQVKVSVVESPSAPPSAAGDLRGRTIPAPFEGTVEDASPALRSAPHFRGTMPLPVVLDEPAAGVRVSPGAASVHPPPPPARPDTTKPYGDLVDEPEPGPPPAEPVSHPHVDPYAATAMLSPTMDHIIRRSEPPGAFPSADADEAWRPSVEPDAYEPPPAAHEVYESRPVSGRPSARPIPREDEADASALVAMQSHVGWGDMSPRAGPVHDPRAGAYHIVPRPADARRHHEQTDIDRLLERALVGGLEGEEAMSELLREAEHGFPRLVDRFPGPLKVDRFKARDLPAASDCGPLLRLLVTMRRATLPFMTVRSASHDVEQRFWATHTLGELLFPESSNAVLPRLFDDDVSVRRVARRAATALVTAGSAGEPLKHSLDHTMKSAEEPVQRRVLAIEALSDIRVPSVVPLLVSVLRDRSESIADAARTALMLVTRQDLGKSAEVWAAWWEQHRHEHRIEWLIQALTHDTPSIRRAAGDELKLITREYFGYYDDLPPRERERAQAAYRQWWIDEGQYRFR